MQTRTNYYRAAPKVVKSLMAMEEAAKDLTIPLTLRELIKMRVSQINGCAYCLDMHAPEARAAGVSQQKLDVLAAWRESPAFDARERAALGWAEALTRIEATGAPDADYDALAAAVNRNVAYAVEHCKLAPEADAVLHGVIAELQAGAEVMEGRTAAPRHDGAVRVVQALKSYAKYFRHPGFKAAGG